MKLRGKTVLRIEMFEGIANVLTFISLIILVIALGKIMFSGFQEWQKDLFLYSTGRADQTDQSLPIQTGSSSHLGELSGFGKDYFSAQKFKTSPGHTYHV